MKTITKALNLPKHKYYETHLNLINGLFPVKITPKEAEVLARFMSLEGDIAVDRFGTTARRMVKEDLELSDGGLGNYLKQLKDKGFIKLDGEGKLIIHPLLNAEPDEQQYAFKLTNMDYVTD